MKNKTVKRALIVIVIMGVIFLALGILQKIKRNKEIGSTIYHAMVTETNASSEVENETETAIENESITLSEKHYEYEYGSMSLNLSLSGEKEYNFYIYLSIDEKWKAATAFAFASALVSDIKSSDNLNVNALASVVCGDDILYSNGLAYTNTKDGETVLLNNSDWILEGLSDENSNAEAAGEITTQLSSDITEFFESIKLEIKN